MAAVTIISYHESKESLKEFHSKLESLETHGTPHLAVVCGTVTKDKTKDKKLYCPQEWPHKVLRDETRLRFFLISKVVNVVVFIPHLFSLALSMPWQCICVSRIRAWFCLWHRILIVWLSSVFVLKQYSLSSQHLSPGGIVQYGDNFGLMTCSI